MHNNAPPIIRPQFNKLQIDESVNDLIGQASYVRLSWLILSCLLVCHLVKYNSSHAGHMHLKGHAPM